MNSLSRRAFLGWLAGTAAGAALAPTLDLDKLLWVPGEKTIFLPPEPALVWPVALEIGDIFTIEGVYAINPMTRRAVPDLLQQFIATRTDTHEFMPAMIPSGLYRNVAALPKRGARVQRLSHWYE